MTSVSTATVQLRRNRAGGNTQPHRHPVPGCTVNQTQGWNKDLCRQNARSQKVASQTPFLGKSLEELLSPNENKPKNMQCIGSEEVAWWEE